MIRVGKIKRKIVVLLILTLLTVLTFSGCTETSDNDTENGNGDFLGSVVATVNGEEITSEEVTMLQQSYIQQGQQLSEEDAIDQFIDQKILQQQSLKDEYMPTDQEAETELETMLQQYQMTLDDLKQQLTQMGMPYIDYLQDFKKEIAQNYLIKELREEADIEYM